ncbi:GGDEF domain-containing protein [Arsukibacterium indicum]|uniref:diguanylate cyclase n=1 Tax=Arsukibacterium indicum TaxID=2848612 RepID=A0ABS6MJZ5_9GAMM|nr:GGDEF domain-containing protein [Arsukibacterium indicum]MBV2128621.1 GGDEF domain-containing protein [Arsukibacterium indicum]
MLARLKSNFYLAMISLVGLMITVCVTPYGIYRLLSGNIVVGIADLVMVLVSICCVSFAWRTGNTKGPGLIMAMAFCVGAILVCINLGVDGVFWVYPFIVFIFFLVSPFKALLMLLLSLSVVVGVALVNPGQIFASTFQLVSFTVTCFVTSLFAYLFAYRTQTQREALKVLATTDSLTGAANRRTLDEALIAAINQHRKAGTEFGLMLLDLDYFKSINDNYGHKVGDGVLTELVPILKAMVRQRDTVFRFGGEEFVILLSDIKQADLHKLADKIRLGVNEHLSLPDGEKLTTSIGIAILQPTESWESWLHRADLALYQAKSQGRNQVVAASSETGT